MQALTVLYAQTLLLGLVVCGLTMMVAPDLGRDIAKRCGVSILLFILGNLLWPPSGSHFLQAAFRMLLALAAIIAAAVWLVHPRSAAHALRVIGILALGVFLLGFALHEIVVALFG